MKARLRAPDLIYHAMSSDDRLLSHYLEKAGQGIFESCLRVFLKDVFTRCEEALHLGVALFDELDDAIRPHARKKLKNIAKRNIVAYDQVMNKGKREDEV